MSNQENGQPKETDELEAICAEYAAWAGNDLSTVNFKRLISAIQELIRREVVKELTVLLTTPELFQHTGGTVTGEGRKLSVNEFSALVRNRIRELSK